MVKFKGLKSVLGSFSKNTQAKQQRARQKQHDRALILAKDHVGCRSEKDNQRSVEKWKDHCNDNARGRDTPDSENDQMNHVSSYDSNSKATHHPSQFMIHGPPPSPTSSMTTLRRIIRCAIYALLQIVYAFRWSIDFCITRLTWLEPLSSHSSLSAYATPPAYSLHINTDDILRSLIILGGFFYFKMRVLAGPLAIMLFVFLGSVSRKMSGRAPSLRDHQQAQRVKNNAEQPPSTKKAMTEPRHMSQQKNKNPSLTMKEATTSAMQLAYTTPRDSVTARDQSHARVTQNLQKQYPHATYAECKRFVKCVNYKEEAASKRINEFLKWRSDCGLTCTAEVKDAPNKIGRHDRVFDQTFVQKDGDDWDDAAKLAISIMTKSHVTQSITTLPQIMCAYEETPAEGDLDTGSDIDRNKTSSLPPRCKDGTRIFHILPARVDLSLATAPTYSLTAALYLDRRLSRSTAELVTLFCDLRGGRGWANPKPWALRPFVQSTASLLGSHYPERLTRLILVPMPRPAIVIWTVIRKCLDPDTAGKVVIVGEGEGSDLPEELFAFVDEEDLIVLDKRRRSFFLGSSQHE